MKNLVILFMLACLFGCATIKPIPYQQKEHIYNNDFETTWSKAISMLTKESFSIQSIDKNNGLLITGFIPTQYLINQARYSLNLFITSVDKNKTKIIITPYFEVYAPGNPMIGTGGTWVAHTDRDKMLIDKYFKKLDSIF